MISITTRPAHPALSDWYTASATVDGYHYHSSERTRIGALMAIVRQLAAKGLAPLTLTK